jgi:hypothetical protein
MTNITLLRKVEREFLQLFMYRYDFGRTYFVPNHELVPKWIILESIIEILWTLNKPAFPFILGTK